ncbi:MAG: peptidoglycan DD-metalloendopeptidase family protein [Woeseiaceae bacterium]|nr:peptidoglycan DD-metalloendopeptidase family protein [Woeseiaceae bacterium]
MNRPASPLLHDYKPSAAQKPAKSKALSWFAVGLGIPLIGVALITALSTDDPQPPATDTPVMRAVNESPLTVDEMDPAEITADVFEPEIVPEPEPIFDKLTLKVGRGDTMERLFRRNGLDIGHLMQIAQLDEARKRFRRIKPGDVYEVTHDEGLVVSLYSRLDLTSGLQIDRGEKGFSAKIIDHPIEIRKRHAYGVIESSLYESAATAGLSDKVIMNIAGIFAWDVDFVLDIREGDSYYVQFEEIWQDGSYVTDGEIVVAEFHNDGRTSQAVRFVDENGRSDYFTPDGRSVRKAFLRSPVDFRVSSSFNPNRLHPVLKTRRPHRGVDYAAPRGTPIKASGDGKVIFRGVKGGYGNTVILQHGGNITTLYAHMQRFASNVRTGTRVRQGQTVGYVGDTGLVSGVHLHYEYRLNGVHRNPRTVELPQAAPIADKYRAKFLAQSAPLLQELEDFKRTKLASAAFDAP